MRVLQIIDSLHPGGAERMAILYANALNSQIERSYLCSTREEGILKSSLEKGVNYLFLGKKSSFDLKALFKLRNFIKTNKIDIVQAHSSSYFIACIIKSSGVSFKIIWHDHYGNSEFLNERKPYLLRFFSYYFDGVIAVNDKLEKWACKKLFCENIIQINNFCSSPKKLGAANIKLKGDPSAIKFICVANLRPQKDHLTLIKAFENFANNKYVSLHLIGEDPGTVYSKKILNYIDKSPMSNIIFYYGSQTNIIGFLLDGDIAVLSSISEGLPVALLEYGLAGLPVISSDVGQCKEVIGENGIIVSSKSINELSKGLDYYYSNIEERVKDAKDFNVRISRLYSEEAVIEKVLNFYQHTLKY